VTGGLAGCWYGIESIPGEWLEQIARRDDIENLFKEFEVLLSK
jgi:ADP-ribosylglycohydrolase